MGFGTVLKDILADKNMTIKELSEATGIPLNTLYSITKRDTANVRQDTLERISKAVDIPANELISCLRSDISKTQHELDILQMRLHEAEMIREKDLAIRKQLAKCLNILTNFNFDNADIDIILATAILLKEPPTTE